MSSGDFWLTVLFGFIAGHNVYSGSGSSNSVVADAKVLLPLIDSFCESRIPQDEGPQALAG